LGTVCNSPCFRCCFILNYATHYTMLFDICQMLNEIHHEDTWSSIAATKNNFSIFGEKKYSSILIND